ncbi:MAG: hypothetical protein U1F16_05590 [Turneriella sp.]
MPVQPSTVLTAVRVTQAAGTGVADPSKRLESLVDYGAHDVLGASEDVFEMPAMRLCPTDNTAHGRSPTHGLKKVTGRLRAFHYTIQAPLRIRLHM